MKYLALALISSVTIAATPVWQCTGVEKDTTYKISVTEGSFAGVSYFGELERENPRADFLNPTGASFTTRNVVAKDAMFAVMGRTIEGTNISVTIPRLQPANLPQGKAIGTLGYDSRFISVTCMAGAKPATRSLLPAVHVQKIELTGFINMMPGPGPARKHKADVKLEVEVLSHKTPDLKDWSADVKVVNGVNEVSIKYNGPAVTTIPVAPKLRHTITLEVKDVPYNKAAGYVVLNPTLITDKTQVVH